MSVILLGDEQNGTCHMQYRRGSKNDYSGTVRKQISKTAQQPRATSFPHVMLDDVAAHRKAPQIIWGKVSLFCKSHRIRSGFSAVMLVRMTFGVEIPLHFCDVESKVYLPFLHPGAFGKLRGLKWKFNKQIYPVSF
ncbi:hypothetical protein [Shimia sp. SDUM112013]|uniref:hypothetical protein n=1 Tax=Shimia sp. SDUM112013 TaxID=3136160 RepID=UPI0032EBC297